MRHPAEAVRTWLPPVLVLVAVVAAAVAITALYGSADAHRRAQLQISALRTDLGDLQDDAFSSDPRSGGSPYPAFVRISKTKRSIGAHVGRLEGDDTASQELRGLRPAVKRMYPLIQQVFEVGAGTGFSASQRTDGLLKQLAVERDAILGQLDRASARYDRAAARTRTRAAIGTGVTLAGLMLAFLFFYLRSGRAQRRAEELATENERLWQVSHDEATTDELTGLGNRRALAKDFARLRRANRADVLLAMFDLDGFKVYNDTFGHGAGDDLLARLGRQLAGTAGDALSAYRMGGDEFCLVGAVGELEGAALVKEAVAALSDAGEGWCVGCSHGVAWVPSQAQDLAEALRVADQNMYADKASRSSAGRQTTAALVQVLAERGDGLDGHSTAVAELSIAVAEQLGLAPFEVQRIGLAGELHDIGKAAIPRTILEKPGPLDEAEWQFVRRHTLIGERIILAAPSLEPVATLVRSSHERVDGGGYPDGLAGEAIPLGARIIGAADAFNAMVSQRPYGRALLPSEAIEELQRCAGSQFDPAVVQAVATTLTAELVAPLA